MAGGELEILVIATAVRMFVFDSHVRKLHPVTDDRQAIRRCPCTNLLRRSIWTSRVPVPSPSTGVEEPLVLAFQFVVHDDPANTGALLVQTLSSGGIDTGELRVMRGFSWLY